MEGESMSEWKEKKLYEVCQKITDGSHYSPVAVIKGYPMLSVKDMREYDFDFSSCKNISNEDFCKMRQNDCIPQVGDVLVAKDGSYLKEIFCCKEYRDIAILSSIAIFRPNQNIISPDFLCYLLKTPFIFNYISKNCVSGSALPRIVLKSFKDVCIPVPDLFTQSEIAGILSSLDAKIETNNKLNEKLEEMAQAIFKSWFVDFEPFKDKPFHETELGMIPEGWEVKNIDHLYDIKYGNNLSTSEIKKSGQYPVYGANGVIGYYDVSNCNDYSVLITSRGNGSGDVYRTHSSKSYVTNNSFIVKPKSNYSWIELSYIYYSFLNINFKSYTNGSAQPQLTNKSIHNIDILLPTKKEIQNFCNLTMPIVYNIELLMRENARLASLRDTLLPRLMSGELIV